MSLKAEFTKGLQCQVAKINELEAEVNRLNTIISAQRKRAAGWIPAADCKPESGTIVFIHCLTESLRKSIILRAVWYDRYTEEAGDGEFEAGEYCEEKDQYYIQEGWYEFNQHEDVHWAVSERVTHWMELPRPPEVIL